MKPRCHTLQRRALALTLSLAAAFAGAAHAQSAPQAADFSGTWHVPWCDAARPAVDCGGFTLHLFQQNERLCGTHLGATTGLSRLDEGVPRSVVGAAVGRTAVLTIRSTRASATGNVYMAIAELGEQVLQWRLADAVLETGGDSVIAQQATLSRQATNDDDQAWRAARQACQATFE